MALRRLLLLLVAEISANGRLRTGVWLILGISLFYCFLVQADRLDAAHRDYAAEAGRFAKAELLLEGEDWPALLGAERDTHGEIKSRYWQAETEGLAQAKLQDALAGLIAGLRMRDARIRSGVSQPMPDLDGIWRVQARLDASYRRGLEPRLLHALATHERKLVVDRLELRPRGRQSSGLVLMVSAYFVGVEAAPAQ